MINIVIVQRMNFNEILDYLNTYFKNSNYNIIISIDLDSVSFWFQFLFFSKINILIWSLWKFLWKYKLDE
jgi:hypothetical protein